MKVHATPFMHKSLAQDETLVAVAYFHPFYMYAAFGLLALWTLVGLGGQFALTHFFNAHPEVLFDQGMQQGLMRMVATHRYVATLAGFFMGLCFFVPMYLKKISTEIILTERRLLYKRGFFTARVEEVDVEQLASDDVRQSIMGRMLDYGSIHVRCIEATDLYLPPVFHPYHFSKALEKVKNDYRDQYMKVERLRHHGTSPADNTLK
ncbi:MAG: PH domain-containing protein [Alphaproteobacteria bacterium]|nr:PH domain-containing protein [Alphaproteobacteria bacterium]